MWVVCQEETSPTHGEHLAWERSAFPQRSVLAGVTRVPWWREHCRSRVRGKMGEKDLGGKSTSALLITPKPFTVQITANWGKFLKRWEYQTTWPASWEICMQVKKQQLEPDMEQQTGSKSGKEYVKAVYCHPAYLTYMQSSSCWAGWSTSWNQDCREKYQ